MAAKKSTKTAAEGKKDKGSFSDFEKEAMKNRAKELKAEATKADGEKAIFDKIDEMPEPDATIAKRVHEIVRATAPHLTPKTWYGMPAYANADGKVVCFFQSGVKYQVRYCTLGFQDAAHLDDGAMWPSAFALTDLTPTVEKQITALVKKAVS